MFKKILLNHITQSQAENKGIMENRKISGGNSYSQKNKTKNCSIITLNGNGLNTLKRMDYQTLF